VADMSPAADDRVNCIACLIRDRTEHRVGTTDDGITHYLVGFYGVAGMAQATYKAACAWWDWLGNHSIMEHPPNVEPLPERQDYG